MKDQPHNIGLLISNPLDRRLLSDFLQESGYAVCTAGPQEDCLEKLKPVSLVIADEALARALGRKLMDLRWHSGVAFLPMLIILPRKADSSPWLRAGFNDVLRFPITKAELSARLDVFMRLREQTSEQYRDLFENALIGIYRSTPEGRLLLANSALVQMLGYSSFKELSELSLEEVEIVPREARAAFKSRIEAEGKIVGVESCWNRRDGSCLFVRETARVIRDDAGKVLYYEGTVEDVSERKRVEQERDRLLASEQAARVEAETANRAKDEFLANLSHELRTPLTSILGWSRMLRTGKYDEAVSNRALETIERNARSQAQIIEDILDVSRIITGKLKLDVRPVELEPVVQAAIDAVRPAAEAKSIHISASFDPKANLVLGDPTRLQQVVWNLVSNSTKFTPPGGRVEVRLERVNSHARITVADTGKGISPRFLPFVFDRFRQADGTSTREHGGLGLGLAIARHLVELQGGTIQADSPGEGQGATFTVNIPLISTRAGAAGPEGADEQAVDYFPLDCPPTLRGLRLLLVDDEVDTLEMLAIALRQCEASVATARSAEEALRLLRQARPDVLISDIGMPGEDGHALIRKVRALEREMGWQTIPSVALTAFAAKEDRMLSLSTGFQTHLSKPVYIEELIAVLEKLAGRDNGRARSEDAG
ncbi:MAG TPA: ATP-binding protein [Blastocatellia bacterium]|nr:ATP-binding protein [Blastocatellia bacterium]